MIIILSKWLSSSIWLLDRTLTDQSSIWLLDRTLTDQSSIWLLDRTLTDQSSIWLLDRTLTDQSSIWLLDRTLTDQSSIWLLDRTLTDQSSIWLLDRTLTDQRGIGSNGDEKVFHIPQSSKTGASQSNAGECHSQDTDMGGKVSPFLQRCNRHILQPQNSAGESRQRST